MWVNIQAMQPNIDWEIEVYDSQTNYLGDFQGYSADRAISLVWGLQTNEYSPPLTDPGFLLDYYVSPAGFSEQDWRRFRSMLGERFPDKKH